MRTASALAAALLVAACQPQDPTGAPAEPPADAPAELAPAADAGDFSQPITARGNEPFWAITVDGSTLTLKRPDAADVTFEAAQPGGPEWTAKAADGRTLTLKVAAGECSDGMSDARYPMTAEAALAGETLKGCAAKTAELPKGQ